VYLLTKVILVDYRQDNLKTYLGFQDPRLTTEEEKKSQKAKCIETGVARSMVEKTEKNVSTTCIKIIVALLTFLDRWFVAIRLILILMISILLL
jgi:hypothetical protein